MNSTKDKETKELIRRLYEDCIKFKKENRKDINCNIYEITKGKPVDKSKNIEFFLFL